VADVRPGAVAALSLVAALVGGAAALAIGKATDVVGDTKTVVVAPAPARGDANGDFGNPNEGVRNSPAQPTSAARPLPGNLFNPARIYRERSAGVVTIYATFGDGDSPEAASQGSGFVVSPKGYILTNSHVVTTAGDGSGKATRAKAVYVQFEDGERVPARLVGSDPFDDVAVVQVDPKLHALAPVPLGDSDDVIVGEPVAAIGSPFGNQNSLSVGVVSATRRSIDSLTSQYNVVDAIQTDAPINRGNSGGPLFDANGLVIGVNAQIRSDSGRNEGVGFAIPINAAKRSLQQLVANGKVSYAFVGIETSDLTPSLARRLGYEVSRAAVISTVRPDSPAARAGLRGGSREVQFNGLSVMTGGDAIVAIDGRRVRSADDVVRIVTEELLPGDVAVFTVLRDGRRRSIPVRLGTRSLGE
jgi:S1-C subfamily serine protease